MAIKPGTPRVSKPHAGNFTHAPAQKRIDEVVSAAQGRGLNALKVDSHEVYLFLKMHSTSSCSCRETRTGINNFEPISDVVPENIGGAITHDTDEVVFDWGRSLFGEQHTSAEDAVDLGASPFVDLPKYVSPDEHFGEDDEADLEFDADSVTTNGDILPTAIDTAPACGICYRTGYQPGLVQYGAQREVLTTLNVFDIDSYTIDRSAAPHQFNKLTQDGFVSFELTVPKYFRTASFSVRNNYDILDERLYVEGKLLTLSMLKSAKGKLVVECRARVFTHVQVVFHTSDPMLANLSQLSRVTDWTQFEAVGALNIVLHSDIENIPVGSVVIVPSKGYGLRITDVPQVKTSKGQSLDWSCSVRFLQPQEQIRSIASNSKIL